MQTGRQLPAVPWFAPPAPLSGRAAGEGARAALKPGTPPRHTAWQLCEHLLGQRHLAAVLLPNWHR